MKIERTLCQEELKSEVPDSLLHIAEFLFLYFELCVTHYLLTYLLACLVTGN